MVSRRHILCWRSIRMSAADQSASAPCYESTWNTSWCHPVAQYWAVLNILSIQRTPTDHLSSFQRTPAEDLSSIWRKPTRTSIEYPTNTYSTSIGQVSNENRLRNINRRSKRPSHPRTSIKYPTNTYWASIEHTKKILPKNTVLLWATTLPHALWSTPFVYPLLDFPCAI